jgi:IrrE N-terminal-like domain
MTVQRLNEQFVRRKVDYILEKTKQTSPPVDLLSVARFQSVRVIEFRPMLLEGSMDVASGGFKIYLGANSFHSMETDDDPDLTNLKPRQRFALAHEIIHTFFYDTSTDPPLLMKKLPKLPILERLCQLGASQLLLPERLLAQEFKVDKTLSPRRVVELAEKYCTSTEVLIRRIDSLENLQSPNKCFILARRDESGQDAQIRAICYHYSFLPYLAKPELYSSLKQAYGSFLEDDFWDSSIWDQHVKRETCTIQIRKRPHSTQTESFFLEMGLSF